MPPSCATQMCVISYQRANSTIKILSKGIWSWPSQLSDSIFWQDRYWNVPKSSGLDDVVKELDGELATQVSHLHRGLQHESLHIYVRFYTQKKKEVKTPVPRILFFFFVSGRKLKRVNSSVSNPDPDSKAFWIRIRRI